MRKVILPLSYLFLFFFLACTPSEDTQLPRLFSLHSSEFTQIDFQNQLDYAEDYNMYTFRNFYNGGGVGLGDINNDGLVDVFFCGNLVDNKLYLNKGNFQFEDITEKAGVACPSVWSSGVSMVDINGDGWLDIYVCKSGRPGGNNRHNELFINNGDLSFTEQSEKYGLNDEGLSTHAAFFDYDKDGDLDCYLLNNSLRTVGGYDLIKDQRLIRDILGGNKLYRNDGASFTDVSEAAGIYGSAIGFGLGVTIGDLNQDGWQDIFVSNDFFERDYLYINQKDGTFNEVLPSQMKEISMSSMGADMADINNDGYPEIFVTDMLPEIETRLKTKTPFEKWDKYQRTIKNGYHHQFTRNVLQLNNQNGSFSEISRFAGVDATDWSWGALIFDMDNDGFKDIFVANGIFKDLTDQDYVDYYSNPDIVRNLIQQDQNAIMTMIASMPSEALTNYAFINQKNLQFQNQAASIGLNEKSFSNGSAYADLDNDGDLDLVINNVNMPSFIYQNEARQILPQNAFIGLELKGEKGNSAAWGTSVTVFAGGQQFYQEVAPNRGFQSTVDQRLLFGLGEVSQIDSIHINWVSGKITRLQETTPNQYLSLDEKDAQTKKVNAQNKTTPFFTEKNIVSSTPILHQENEFVDFDREQLLFKMRSTEGPKIALGDVNADGKEDFYLCGAKGQTGSLWIQTDQDSFYQYSIPQHNPAYEEVDAHFFDVDQDQDMDLIVASGGSEYTGASPNLQDQLYLNDGNGNFSLSPQQFAKESTACISIADYDKDGDLDIFTGARLKSFLYGVPVDATIWENKGDGTFKALTKKEIPAFERIGLVTDAEWMDIDQDDDLDVVVVGEWMPITILENENGSFTKRRLKHTNGWWNCMEVADLNNDGQLDVVLGNQGYNSRIQTTQNEPAELYVNDFDKNGMIEQILCTYNEGTSYPVVLRSDLVKQLPALKKDFLKYHDYKGKTINDIFSEERVNRSIRLKANYMANAIAWNEGGTFRLEELPNLAQLSSVYAIELEDINKDGYTDILLGGNLMGIKPEIGIQNGSYSLLLLNQRDGTFDPLLPNQSGISIEGQIRDFQAITIGNKEYLLVAMNNEPIRLLEKIIEK